MASSPGLSWSALGSGVPDALSAEHSVPTNPVAALDQEYTAPKRDSEGGSREAGRASGTPQPSMAMAAADSAEAAEQPAIPLPAVDTGAQASVSSAAGPQATSVSAVTPASPEPVPPSEGPRTTAGARNEGSAGAEGSSHRGSGSGTLVGGGDRGGTGASQRARRASSGGGGGAGGKGARPGGNGGGSSDRAAAAAAAAAAASAPLHSLEPGNSVVEMVSREVIRKLRLAASAGSAEDRHVVCEELFADITCVLDASARAALLGPAAAARTGGGGGGGGGDTLGPAAAGGGGAASPESSGGAAGARGGRLYYEVLAVHYARRAAADSARALLHLCQLLWDTPWVAPIYALLLHRFLLLPRDVGSPAAAASSGPATGSAATAPAPPSYADQRVKHLNVLAHGSRQLLLGDVHSGLSRFQPLWAFLALEVAGLGSSPLPPPLAAAAALPPVAHIDAVPAVARPWLLAVAAAFLPYYALDEQVYDMARRFPPPMALPPPLPLPLLRQLPLAAATAAAAAEEEGARAGAMPGASPAAAASLAGLDFLVVEVTDTLGRIHSEAGLLKYLHALRALARPPPPPAPPRAAGGPGTVTQGSQPAADGSERAVQEQQEQEREGETAQEAAGEGGGEVPRRREQRQRPPQAPPPLAGLPTITKLRLQNELYSLTSGGGPRYAPPEVRRAAFAALDALFPGGRSLRWLVRWASRTLHLEWLEDEAASGESDPWAGRGWLGWLYWPIHWCTAMYGRILLAVFQLLYGLVVWRSWRGGGGGGGVSVTGDGGEGVPGGGARGVPTGEGVVGVRGGRGAITAAGGDGGGGGGHRGAAAVAAAQRATGDEAERAGSAEWERRGFWWKGQRQGQGQHQLRRR